MSRKSRITNELKNGFPEWTRVRSDDQSVGSSFLNTMGLEMELLFTELFRGQKNTFLTTAFTGEIDQVYRFSLPSNFTFTLDSENSLSPIVVTPTMSGLVGDMWYPVSEVIDGSLRSFWYESIPTRVSEISQTAISGYLVASGLSTDIDLMLVTSGLALPNRLTVIADGEQLISVDIDNNLLRSKVRISGTTWKDTVETEDVVFLFAESKQTFKAWTSVSKIQPIDFSSESTIDIYSHQFNQPYYLDSFDTLSQFTTSRENLPLFWKLTESISGYSVLQAQRYTTDKAIDLLKNKPTLVEYQNWELLNSDNDPILLRDITLLPNEQRFIGIDNQTLYIYDTYFELPDLKDLTLKTPGGLIDIETSSDFIVREEEVEISPVFRRPIKTIVKHRVKITYPDGIEQGVLLDGSLVSVLTNYWITGEVTDRFIRQPFFVQFDDFGQHKITLECVYLDGSTEYAERAILVLSKQPLSEIDISHIITTASGVDIDHLNKLLILDTSGMVHELRLHSDIALIDFEAKEITFRERYDEVKVIK